MREKWIDLLIKDRDVEIEEIERDRGVDMIYSLVKILRTLQVKVSLSVWQGEWHADLLATPKMSNPISRACQRISRSTKRALFKLSQQRPTAHLSKTTEHPFFFSIVLFLDKSCTISLSTLSLSDYFREVKWSEEPHASSESDCPGKPLRSCGMLLKTRPRR